MYFIFSSSGSFRPEYSRLGEIRALLPPGAPVLAATATATKAITDDVCRKLEMAVCKVVFVSPDRENIYFEVFTRTDIHEDMSPLLEELRANKINTPRVIVYCRSLNLCSSLYFFFLSNLGSESYYPSGAVEISDNRLFGMFHAQTPQHNKDVILSSMQKEDGIVRVVFATVALGMGVNFVGLNRVIHYGAPSSIEDYFQECGRAGRSGDPAKSTIYWKPSDAPRRKNVSDPRNAELCAVRNYLENNRECRRYQLLRYFDINTVNKRDQILCCDVCASLATENINKS